MTLLLCSMPELGQCVCMYGNVCLRVAMCAYAGVAKGPNMSGIVGQSHVLERPRLPDAGEVGPCPLPWSDFSSGAFGGVAVASAGGARHVRCGEGRSQRNRMVF